jgi:hypothetical protein
VVEQRPFKPLVVGSTPTAPTKLFISQRLFLRLTPFHRLTPIELIHRVLFNSCRTVFYRVTLLVADHMRVHAKRNPCVTVP